MRALFSNGTKTKRSLIIKFSVGGMFLLLYIFWGFVGYFQTARLFPSQFFAISEGDSVVTISKRLKSTGIISSDILFRWGVLFSGLGRQLKIGDYFIEGESTPYEIAQLLVSTKMRHNKITIPEGLTNWQTFTLLRGKSFLKDDHPIIPPEGMLYPETYVFSRGTPLSRVIEEMRRLMEKNLMTLWSQRLEGLPFASPMEALILASIVEKEAWLESEKPLIAGVYINRLRRNMLLQADPTVIYGLSGGKGELGRPLVRSDLMKINPFNTYRIKGLPPTPIASPSLSSLKAVLINPEKTNALFFVADGKGGHHFSAHYHHHKKNITKLREIQKTSLQPKV